MSSGGAGLRVDAALSKRLRELLEAGRDGGAFPAAAAWVAADAAGRRPRVGTAAVGGVGLDALWDLASLTKPMAVGTLAMRGVAAGWLDLRAPWPALGGQPAAWALGHRAGLPAWEDLVAWLDGHVAGWRPGEARALGRLTASLRRRARGAAAGGGGAPAVYSDLGYILLGWALERRLGRSLAGAVERGGWGGRYRPTGAARRRAVPTGWCPRRGRRLVGEVHDVNCWALGGGAGHAGMFATADEVGRWALGLARAAAGRRRLPGQAWEVDGGVVRAFWDRAAWAAPGETWALAWDTPSPGGASLGGRTITDTAVGHFGFTGTSVWVDRARGLVMVLLTNRVALGEAAVAPLRAFRPRFHDEAAAAAL